MERLRRTFLDSACCGLLLAAILCASSQSQAQMSDNNREYRIKAAYLYNLIKFIRWPDNHNFKNQSTNICIYGSNPFGQQLAKLDDRRANGREIDIEQLDSDETDSHCDMIFIGREAPEFQELDEEVHNHHLLIGETDDFTNQQGIIALVVQENSVQLHINLSRAKQRGFKISGNLLEVATTIQ